MKMEVVVVIGEDWVVGCIDVLDVEYWNVCVIGECDYVLCIVQCVWFVWNWQVVVEVFVLEIDYQQCGVGGGD